MSLERFMKSRLVVQSPSTRIYDAVRAMEDNGIGAVLVHDGKSLVGMVTDRDASLKVIGEDLDPFEFELADIMSAPIVSVASTASVIEVAQLMLDRHVRRIPIVDGSAVRGLVTLDDLILEHAVDAATLAAIVRAQLSEPARLKPKGQLGPQARAGVAADPRRAERQREARRRRTYARLLNRVLAFTDLTLTDQAERALLIVVSGLCRRLTPEEAADFLAQLPSSLRQYAVANVPAGPDPSIDRDALEEQVNLALEVGPERAARVVQEVARALQDSVSAGELQDVVSQLPPDMKELFGG